MLIWAYGLRMVCLQTQPHADYTKHYDYNARDTLDITVMPTDMFR